MAIATVTSNPVSPFPSVPVTFSIDWDEVVTGLTSTAWNVFIENSDGNFLNVVDLVTGSGSHYEFVFTPADNDGNFVVWIGTNSVDQGNTQDNWAFYTDTSVVLTLTPTITFGSVSAYSGQSLPVHISFTEVPTGFTLADLSTNVGTFSGFGGSDVSYSVTLTLPSGTGTAIVSIAADVISEGNLAAEASINYAPIEATLTSPISSVLHSGAIRLDITFDFFVTGLQLSDFTTSVGTLSNLQGSGRNYTVVFTLPASGIGTATVTLVADSVNQGNASASVSVSYGPLIATITPAVSQVFIDDVFVFNVVFPIVVSGLTVSDFTINVGMIVALTGSGGTYGLECRAPSMGLGTIIVTLAMNSVDQNNAASTGSVSYAGISPDIPVIGLIGDQVILAGTDWHTTVTISNNPDKAYVKGDFQGFHTDFEDGVLNLHGNSSGRYSGRLATVVAEKGDVVRTRDFMHSVISSAPIIESFGPWDVIKGDTFEEEIVILNPVTALSIKGPWVGLRGAKGGAGAIISGRVPTDVNLTIDTGIIEVVASSNFGDVMRQGTINIVERLLPFAPTNVRATDQDRDSISLAWNAATVLSGLPGITNYVFRYRTGTDAYTAWATTGGIALTYILTGLDNGVSYDIQIAAENSNGIGTASEVFTHTTDAVDLPGVCIDLEVDLTVSGQGGVYFNEPLDNGGGPITHFRARALSSTGGIWAGGIGIWTETSYADADSTRFPSLAFRALFLGTLNDPDNMSTGTVTIELQARNVAGYGESVVEIKSYP